MQTSENSPQSPGNPRLAKSGPQVWKEVRPGRKENGVQACRKKHDHLGYQGLVLQKHPAGHHSVRQGPSHQAGNILRKAITRRLNDYTVYPSSGPFIEWETTFKQLGCWQAQRKRTLRATSTRGTTVARQQNADRSKGSVTWVECVERKSASEKHQEGHYLYS